jgi:site-specific DNA-methyltransferase (adenine-specific)
VALFPDTNKGTARVGKPGGSTFGGTAMSDEVIGTWYGDSGSAARFFYCAKASKKDRNEGLDGFAGKEIGAKGNGLARKCATCSASVIDGCECVDRTFINPSRANHHPTVKPTTLMQYLVRLVTPPNGIVLDPFLGSGSTGKAAMYEGFNFIGIELTPEYLPIAKARILFALKDKEGELDFEPQ